LWLADLLRDDAGRLDLYVRRSHADAERPL
jgi:hypothetical protein